MDGDRFDSLTRAFGSGRSRRGVLKGLGAAALGAVGLSRLGAAEAASSKSNSACAHFCAAVFGADTPAAGQCTSDAAHGKGLCYDCGPAAPAGSTAQVCGGVCIPACTAQDPCHVAGVCDPAKQMCTNPVATVGTICAAAPDLCTNQSTCDARGNCVAGGPVTCTGGDQCNTPTCDVAAGGCTTTPALDGTPCDSGGGVGSGACVGGACVANACTAGSACDSGQGLTTCNENSNCFCGSTAEDTPACIVTNGGTCGDICSSSADCVAEHDAGWVCVANTCCGNVCEQLCALPGAATTHTSSAAVRTTGPQTP